MKKTMMLSLWISLFALESAIAGESTIDLKRKLVSVDISRPTWPKALNVFQSRLGFPLLLELDTMMYRSASIMHGKTETEAAVIMKQCRVHLKNVTVEEVLKCLLKDAPNYQYEVVDGVVLHVYPNGIQNRTNYPLNTVVRDFKVAQKDISSDWYRKDFEALIDPMRIDLGNVKGSGSSTCLSPRGFQGVTLRDMLLELSKTCRTQWVFEPLPPEEVKIRITDWGDDFYPQGKRIEARGGNWYQLHCLESSEDSVEDGVLR